jgi:hypothetical protein
LLLDLSYLQGPWHCEPEEVEFVEPFKVQRCTFSGWRWMFWFLW